MIPLSPQRCVNGNIREFLCGTNTPIKSTPRLVSFAFPFMNGPRVQLEVWRVQNPIRVKVLEIQD